MIGEETEREGKGEGEKRRGGEESRGERRETETHR